MAGEWMAQLSDDLKAHEALEPYRDGDLSAFTQAHIETLGKVTELDGSNQELTGKVTDLEGKLANSIPKLGENATDEEVAAFRTALGVPAKPEDYEFPQIEGQENDQAMESWAQKVFWEAGIPKDKAAFIGAQWNAFIQGIAEADEAEAKKAEEEADKKLREEWGADYDKNKAETQRGYGEFIKIVPEFEDLLKETVLDGVTLGNHTVMLKIFHAIGSAMGEDWSPQAKQKETEVKEGLIYDKSPAPPKNQ